MNIFPEEWQQERFFREQILTYLGNKRKLLPLIYRAIISSGLDPKRTTFLDLFAGSGIVSRLAKKMDFHTIMTNDWEPYSAFTQSLYIKESPESISKLFKGEGGLAEVINELNNLPKEKFQDFYISRYYAPKNLHKFDLQKERLFYTPENAQTIDAIREKIEEKYPINSKLTQYQKREKNILVALLLYKSSVHNNTSGVFKAYYKDFGGYGHHSLKRILTPLKLDLPVLISGTKNVQVFQKDAMCLLDEIQITTDYTLAYLDPPYNIHQYGSNYHMLNTITQWDKLDLIDSYKVDGSLKDKAGIRKDWKNRKSTFCSTQSAIDSFTKLILNLNVDVILISYSIDGIIPFEKMLDILLQKGKVSIDMNDYTTYRGGKKSTSRKNSNIEFILSVDTRENASMDNKIEILSIIEKQKFTHTLKGLYKHQELKKYFSFREGVAIWKQNEALKITLSDWNEFDSIEGVSHLQEKESQNIIKDLSTIICKNKQEEIEELFYWFSAYKKNKNIQKDIVQLILHRLKFLAYYKNREDFLHFFSKLKKNISMLEDKDRASFEKKLETLMQIYQKRVEKYGLS